MATPKEIDRELTERLFELLAIQKYPNELKMAIGRIKSSLSKEQIAWVEEQVEKL